MKIKRPEWDEEDLVIEEMLDNTVRMATREISFNPSLSEEHDYEGLDERLAEAQAENERQATDTRKKGVSHG